MLLRGSPLEQSHFTNLSHQPHVPATRSTQPSSRADPFYTFDTNSSDWLKTDSGSAQKCTPRIERTLLKTTHHPGHFFSRTLSLIFSLSRYFYSENFRPPLPISAPQKISAQEKFRPKKFRQTRNSRIFFYAPLTMKGAGQEEEENTKKKTKTKNPKPKTKPADRSPDYHTGRDKHRGSSSQNQPKSTLQQKNCHAPGGSR